MANIVGGVGYQHLGPKYLFIACSVACVACAVLTLVYGCFDNITATTTTTTTATTTTMMTTKMKDVVGNNNEDAETSPMVVSV